MPIREFNKVHSVEIPEQVKHLLNNSSCACTHGLYFEVNGGAYNDLELNIKLTTKIMETNNGITSDQEIWNRLMPQFGFQPSDMQKTIRISNLNYIITGVNTKAKKNIVRIHNIRSKQSFGITPEQAKHYLEQQSQLRPIAISYLEEVDGTVPPQNATIEAATIENDTVENDTVHANELIEEAFNILDEVSSSENPQTPQNTITYQPVYSDTDGTPIYTPLLNTVASQDGVPVYNPEPHRECANTDISEEEARILRNHEHDVVDNALANLHNIANAETNS